MTTDELYDYILQHPYLELEFNRIVNCTFSKIIARKNIKVSSFTMYTDEICRQVQVHVRLDTQYDIKQWIQQLINKAVADYRSEISICFELNEEQVELLTNEIYEDIIEEITDTIYVDRIEGIEA